MVFDVSWIITFGPFLQQSYEFLKVLACLQRQMGSKISSIHYHKLESALFGKVKIVGIDELMHVGLLWLIVNPYLLRNL